MGDADVRRADRKLPDARPETRKRITRMPRTVTTADLRALAPGEVLTARPLNAGDSKRIQRLAAKQGLKTLPHHGLLRIWRETPDIVKQQKRTKQ